MNVEWRIKNGNLRFTIYGLRFTVYDLRFTIYGLRFTIYGLRFTDLDLITNFYGWDPSPSGEGAEGGWGLDSLFKNSETKPEFHLLDSKISCRFDGI